MFVIILFNSFLGWFLISLMGSFLGTSGSIYLLSILGCISFLVSVLAFIDVGLFSNLIISKFWVWFSLYGVFLEFGLLFDSLTVMMLMIVSGISLLVYWYSVDYMSGDRHCSSFLSYLSLFSFFMFVLVTARSYLQMFMGWEGVGIASFLLINFWSSSLAANKAAFKAMLFNSIGDYCLSLCICMVQLYFGSVNYSLVNSLVPFIGFFQSFVLILISSLLFFAACGKSAQLGLHFWLPDAMEGPTRVSALIHAATMVTAGVYVMMSSSRILEFCPKVLVVVALIGGFTAIVSALIGLAQSDMKKMMAFSTCSQLGYMTLACGLSLYDVSLFHLFTHAIFKALLFLSSGVIIHALSDEQSLMSYGALIYWLPWTYICVLIGSLALGGLPFLSGYYSKDTILELVSTNSFTWVLLLWFLDSFAAGITCIYSFSLIILVFFSYPKFRFNFLFSKSMDACMMVSLVFLPLALGSVFLGFLFEVVLIGEGSLFWGNSIFMNPVSTFSFIDFHWSSQLMKLVPTGFAFFCLFFSFFVLNSSFQQALRLKYISNNFLFSSFFLDVLVSFIGINMVVFSHSVTFQLLDKGLFEIIGVKGFSLYLFKTVNVFKIFSSGHIFIVVFWVLSCFLFGLLCAFF